MWVLEEDFLFLPAFWVFKVSPVSSGPSKLLYSQRKFFQDEIEEPVSYNWRDAPDIANYGLPQTCVGFHLNKEMREERLTLLSSVTR